MVSLNVARERKTKYQTLLSQNINPRIHEIKAVQEKNEEISNTLEKIAALWFENRKLRVNFFT